MHVPTIRPAALALLAVAAAACGGADSEVDAPAAPATPASESAAPAAPTTLEFRPADGWETSATGVTAPPQAMTAITATIPLDDVPGLAPEGLAATLRPGDLVVQAAIVGRRGLRPAADGPALTLPLTIAQGVDQTAWEGGSGHRTVVAGHAGGWRVEAIVYFGAADPDAATRARADEALARLVLPDRCPAALTAIGEGDAAAAVAAVRALLVVGVDESQSPPVDYRDPELVARSAPTAGIDGCDATDATQTLIVDVTYPHVAEGIGDRHQSYAVSRSGGRLDVWARIA